MRFVIAGAGAIGAYMGARMARAGLDVTLFARGPHLRAMQERGIQIRAADGEFTAVARSCRIENVQIAGLFVDELTGPRAHVENGEVRMRSEAPKFLRARVVRVEIELAVAIGAEVDRIADPLRVDVVLSAFQ